MERAEINAIHYRTDRIPPARGARFRCLTGLPCSWDGNAAGAWLRPGSRSCAEAGACPPGDALASALLPDITDTLPSTQRVHHARNADHTTDESLNMTDPDYRDGEAQNLYERFVGPNAAYYILSWDRGRGGNMSWNWSAFFFGEAWLLYRKMYGYAVLYSIARLVITPVLTFIPLFSDGVLNNVAPLVMPYTFILNILIGLYGNPLYQRHASQKLRLARASFKPEHLALGVQSLGGVSLLALLLIPVLGVLEHILLLLYENDFSFNWVQSYQII